MSLKAFFENIMHNGPIDYSCGEINDIVESVKTLLERYTRAIQERIPSYVLTAIEPCGSYKERTSLWKTARSQGGHESNYIELDFLAVLKRNDGFNFRSYCSASGCIHIEGDFPYLSDDPDEFLLTFLKEVEESAIETCSRFEIKNGTLRHSPLADSPKNGAQACKDCDVCTATGSLRLLPDPLHNKKDKLLFEWKSNAKSLLQFDCKTLERGPPLKTIQIHVDFLPAFSVHADELGYCYTDQETFIVAKRCSTCTNSPACWRVSNFMTQCEQILALSDAHRKCYMVIKYFLEQMDLLSNSKTHLSAYHVKIVVLNHHSTCRRTQDDYAKCVITILKDIKRAFASQTLCVNIRPDSGSGINILPSDTIVINKTQRKWVKIILRILYKIKYKLKIGGCLTPTKKRYSVKNCADIIQRMVEKRQNSPSHRIRLIPALQFLQYYFSH